MTHITVITGGRADWGLLSPVCRAIENDPNFTLRIVACGQHLMANATSLAAIKNDGFSVNATIDMGLTQADKARDITIALGKGITGFAQEFDEHRPDLLLILGDRYEIMGAVQAALIAKVPVAHLCGGDITEGAIDDAIRHAMTKMSHLHFTTNEDAKKRVIQLGETPNTVHNVGNPGLDHIHTIEKMDRDTFFKSINFTPNIYNLLVTFHPVTLEQNSLEQCQNMLDALAMLKNDTNIILTGSNADPEGMQITQMAKDFAAHNQNSIFIESLGSKRYLNALRHVNAMVGNSSSGLYEAPSFGIPTVNIGTRQQGRIKASTVIDCIPEKDAIFSALQQAMQTPKVTPCNPYGDGNTAQRILDILKETNISPQLCNKVFLSYDIL
ncbi:MAG: UDP-N-acetylglucosamine 2-epimerase (hydrolyzing) [Alphaproteobacteria bacterium]|nr:UDP-N-acetylglucosamine 2-epimerase (hydrolyzing) [Alphaproteobacteria bacterium]|tara:strand:- start:21181 stop:22332 length:1152 start_codon:yes stop_codon:yes gene_type:complete